MGYGLYLGKVVGTMPISDSGNMDGRLQIRIIPQMYGIEESMCPQFPFFFKDKFLCAQANNMVWCICNDDFSVGYVLGLANYNDYPTMGSSDGNGDWSFTASEDGSGINLCIPKSLQDSIDEHIKNVDVTASIYWTNIDVTYWSDTCIHLIEKSTGGKIIAYNMGTFYIMRPSSFIVHIENGSNSANFKMDNNGISLSGKNISLDSESVGLGKDANFGVVRSIGGRADVSSTSPYVRA